MSNLNHLIHIFFLIPLILLIIYLQTRVTLWSVPAFQVAANPFESPPGHNLTL